MGAKAKIILFSLAVVTVMAGFIVYAMHTNIPVLEPKGVIGQKERNLIIIASILSLIVVIPVYIMLISFAWRFREGNKKTKYLPNFEHSRLLESIWWGVPLTIITVLGIITWTSSRDLDPFKSLESNSPPLKIQVISLPWKWLFIYPQQEIASVNYLQIPTNKSIDFEITSDAPMNSFWIPQLGGQIYAMNGMTTHLHLQASETGLYQGVSANISGDGFAGMHFPVYAVSDKAYDNWANKVKLSTNNLNIYSYSQLAKPSQNNPVTYYRLADNTIYNSVVDKYLEPVFLNNSEGAL